MTAARKIVVEGVEIPESLIAQEAQNHPSLSAADAWAASAKALAIKALLLGRARELGLQPQPQWDEQGRQETEEEALVRAVLDTEVEVTAPTSAECRRLYDAHPTRFQIPALYEASHILIAPAADDPPSVEAARATAEQAVAALAEGRASFADLARSLSDCPSASDGGRLGHLRQGDLTPEVETVLLALPPGATAPAPVRSRFGWHVLRLERRTAPRRAPFDQVEAQIRLHLESRAWAAAAARYTADLAEQAKLRGVSLTLSPTGEIADRSLSLGDMLADEDTLVGAEAWLAVADPALAERTAQAAAKAGLGVQDFGRESMAAFVAEASDERWTQLISAAQDAEDPALAAIAQILRSRLVPQSQTFTLIRRRGA